MRWPVVLFDLDGTLTDPGPGITRCVAHALERVGHPGLTDAELRRFIGPPLHESFAALGLDPTPAVASYRERFSDVGIFENALIDGIPGLLSQLRLAGIRLGVATSKPQVFAVRILEHFGIADPFEVVCGSGLDGSLGTKAEVVRGALDALEADPAQVVLVGDREHDVLGARAVGVEAIGVTWGYAEPGELEAAGPVAIVQSVAELTALLLDQASDTRSR